MIVLKIPESIKKHGITPNPDRDQHFMIDESALEKVISAAEVEPEDVILEIGAGIGNLTKLLAKNAKTVYAVEKDSALIGTLKQETGGFQNIEIIAGDALKIRMPIFDKLVANLPYQICEALLQRLIFVTFKSAAICVPETFAKTVCAKEGKKEHSKLSVMSQAFFDTKIAGEIARDAFYPMPRTKSAVLKLVVKKQLSFQDHIMQELFRQQDKKVKNALREAIIFASQNTGGNFGTKRAARDVIAAQNLPEKMLDQEVAGLSAEDLMTIRKAIYKL